MSRLHRLAYVIAFLWAGWWIFFGVASAIGEGDGVIGMIMHILFPGGLFLLSAFIALKRRTAGAWLLVLEGVAIAIGYPVVASNTVLIPTILFVLLSMALPPLAAGLMLWGSGKYVA